MPKSNQTLEERFWAKVTKTDTCWLWNAAKTKQGYGRINVGGRLKLAHRFSLQLEMGELDGCLLVLHACDNPACVNPAHLRLGTSADNAHDRTDHGRQWQQAKTHCPKGHPLNGNNLRPGRQTRQCLTCNRQQDLARYHAKKHNA